MGEGAERPTWGVFVWIMCAMVGALLVIGGCLVWQASAGPSMTLLSGPSGGSDDTDSSRSWGPSGSLSSLAGPPLPSPTFSLVSWSSAGSIPVGSVRASMLTGQPFEPAPVPTDETETTPESVVGSETDSTTDGDEGTERAGDAGTVPSDVSPEETALSEERIALLVVEQMEAQQATETAPEPTAEPEPMTVVVSDGGGEPSTWELSTSEAILLALGLLVLIEAAALVSGWGRKG